MKGKRRGRRISQSRRNPVARHDHNRGGVHKPKKGKGSYRRERVELHGERD